MAQVLDLARAHGCIRGPKRLQRTALERAAQALQEPPAVERGEGVRENDEKDEATNEREDDRVAGLAHTCIVLGDRGRDQAVKRKQAGQAT